MIKNISLIVFLLIFISGCGPSYPKGKLTESVEKVLKDEYGLEGQARLVEKTLYLNIHLKGLTNTEKEALSQVMKTIQNALLTVTRVTLSSDAYVDYMVVNAKDSDWGLSFKLIERFDDVKGLLYHKISRGDYEGRLVIEIETRLNDKSAGSSDEAQELHPITLQEFMGRLIVSQVNSLGRDNPFLSVLLNNSKLNYDGYTADELIVKIDKYLDESVASFFEALLRKEAQQVFKKYNAWQPKRIKIVTKDDKEIYLVF